LSDPRFLDPRLTHLISMHRARRCGMESAFSFQWVWGIGYRVFSTSDSFSIAWERNCWRGGFVWVLIRIWAEVVLGREGVLGWDRWDGVLRSIFLVCVYDGDGN